MLFSRKLSLPALIDMCRSMRFALNSGLMLRDVMDLLANKGNSAIRNVAMRISKDLKAGWSLQESLQHQEKYFPPLFIAIAAVGEESGNLPEVMGEMERYYMMRQKLRREFRAQIAWPMTQFFLAFIVVTLLIYILGVIAPPVKGGKHLDPLGLGLSGPEGATKFFFGGIIIFLAGIALYLILKLVLARKAVVERFLLHLPLIGPALSAMALARFCIAGRLMLETSLSIFKTLRLAFIATDNMAYITRYPRVEASLRQGNTIATSFQKARIFPAKFLSAVAVAEESGRLPETLRYQAEEYDDETRRRLTFLSKLLGALIFLGVGIVIVIIIFTIFLNIYVGQIKNVEQGGAFGTPPPK
jgi:type IV pilus assembly protein PilC